MYVCSPNLVGCCQDDPVRFPLFPLSGASHPEVLRYQGEAESLSQDGLRPGLQLGEVGEENGIIGLFLNIFFFFCISVSFEKKM